MSLEDMNRAWILRRRRRSALTDDWTAEWPPAYKADESKCRDCGGSGKRYDVATADHILTDSQPWRNCPTCGGTGR